MEKQKLFLVNYQFYSYIFIILNFILGGYKYIFNYFIDDGRRFIKKQDTRCSFSI